MTLSNARLAFDGQRFGTAEERGDEDAARLPHPLSSFLQEWDGISTRPFKMLDKNSGKARHRPPSTACFLSSVALESSGFETFFCLGLIPSLVFVPNEDPVHISETG